MTLWAIKTPKGKLLEETVTDGNQGDSWLCLWDYQPFENVARGEPIYEDTGVIGKRLGYKAVKVKLVEVEGRKKG